MNTEIIVTTKAHSEKVMTTLLGQENREFFVARYKAGHSLCYIEQRYEYSMWLSENEARFENFFVWPEYRRARLASVLTDYAIGSAAGREFWGITQETNEMNTASVALCTKHNFPTGHPGTKMGSTSGSPGVFSFTRPFWRGLGTPPNLACPPCLCRVR